MFPSEIQKRINKNNTKDIVGNMTYVLMREFHLSYREIKQMPLNDILFLLTKLHQEKKEIESKHGRRHNN